MSNATRLGPRNRTFCARAGAALAILFLGAIPSAASAQDAGASVSVTVVDDTAISADGDLSEWADIPLTVTVGGPQPSPDPGLRGRLRWQVAADSTTLYLAATVTDDLIVVGDDPNRYWDDDSIEFYLNLSDDLTTTEYGSGIAQIRITPVGLSDQSPTAVTVNGNNFEQFPVRGVTFATNDGWGSEVAIDITEFASPVVGERFGIQIDLNGSSGAGRDIKLIWSSRDVDDTSFEDPSVFGQGVFVTGAAAQTDSAPAAVEDATGAVGSDISELESTEAEVITGSEQQRSLLYAAVASSIAVLLGGLWFERKRKKDEARHAEAAAATAAGAGDAQSSEVEL